MSLFTTPIMATAPNAREPQKGAVTVLQPSTTVLIGAATPWILEKEDRLPDGVGHGEPWWHALGRFSRRCSRCVEHRHDAMLEVPPSADDITTHHPTRCRPISAPSARSVGQFRPGRTGGWLPRAGRHDRAVGSRRTDLSASQSNVPRSPAGKSESGPLMSTAQSKVSRSAQRHLGSVKPARNTRSSRETPGPAEGRSPLPDLRLSSAGLDVSISIGPRDPTPTNRGRCRCRVVPVRSPRRTSTGSGPRSPVPAIPSGRLELKSGGITRRGGSVSEG